MHYDLQGVRMPALGLGTYRLRGDDARRAVAHALATGYRHIDTAQMYDNEAEIGHALQDAAVPRADVFLTTKVWHANLAAAPFAQAVAESLAALQTDYVDLLLVHWPNADVPLGETLGALQAAREAGQARLVGVSNFPPGMLRRALAQIPDLAVNQVEHHVYLGQQPLLDAVRANGMVLTSYSPVAQGRVTDDPVLQGIAETHGVTPGQIALAYLLGMDRVTAIPKAASPANQAANLAAAEITLSADERAQIDALPKDLRLVIPPFAPDWDA
jgi:2,5-diketo-D-gluconate reductase B